MIKANVARGVRFQAAPPMRRRALTADEWFSVRKCHVGDDWLFAEVQMATGARVEEIRGMETGLGHRELWEDGQVHRHPDAEKAAGLGGASPAVFELTELALNASLQ